MKQQTPNIKHQTSFKPQAAKSSRRLVAGLGFEVWDFSGAWGLALGVSAKEFIHA